MSVMPNYKESRTALKYLDFLNSKNGQIQKEILLKTIKKRLSTNYQSTILDAGCGSGWLAAELRKSFTDVRGCDSSAFLIKFAQSHYPEINFKNADFIHPLPYPADTFDCIILNMVGPDTANLESMFAQVAKVLKTSGKLIFTIPNPSHTYPVAQWKRSLYDVLLGHKPKLIIKNSPASGKQIQREFGKNIKIDSYYYDLAEYSDSALVAGLKLTATDKIRSQVDSTDFDLTYQLYRYPLLLLLEFCKI